MEEKSNYTYRHFLTRFFNVLFKTNSEWKTVNHESCNINDILAQYSLILMAICTITKFLFLIFSVHEEIYVAMIKSALLFAYLFGGLYLSYYLARALIYEYEKEGDFKIIAYSATPLYIATILETFLFEIYNEFAYFVYALILYCVFIAYNGIRNIYELKKKDSLYIGISLTLIIICVHVFFRIIYKLIIFSEVVGFLND